MTKNNYSILVSRTKIKFQNFSIQNYIKEIIYLTNRLILQTLRRPSSIISGVIQPLLWLILFGGLFQNIPLNLLNTNNNYGPFLSCGILIFTSFTGSLNAGLPIIFDREFGFLNRLLVTPIISRNTIILAATLFIICTTMIQNFTIILFSLGFFKFHINLYQLSLIFFILFLIAGSISNISLSLAFILPGHIEFLAFILIINLPMLFASTALAPLYLMPYWLQVISKLNPLTYAIEGIRFIVFNHAKYFDSKIISIFNINLNLLNIIALLLIVKIISLSTTQNIITNKLE